MTDKYYCTKCKRKHYKSRGAIYDKHLEYKGVKQEKTEDEEEKIPGDKILFYNPTEMTNKALRQIKRLRRRMRWAVNKTLYRREINKVILSER